MIMIWQYTHLKKCDLQWQHKMCVWGLINVYSMYGVGWTRFLFWMHKNNQWYFKKNRRTRRLIMIPCAVINCLRLPRKHVYHSGSYWYNEKHVILQVWIIFHIREHLVNFVLSACSVYWNTKIKIAFVRRLLNYSNKGQERQ